MANAKQKKLETAALIGELAGEVLANDQLTRLPILEQAAILAAVAAELSTSAAAIITRQNTT